MTDMAQGGRPGRSFFRILQGLMEEPSEDPPLAAASRMAEEFALLGRSTVRKRGAGIRRPDGYGEFVVEEEAPQVEPDTSIEGVRRELHIRPQDPVEELRRIRKRFAAVNHPDRQPGARRVAAEQRMKIANSIIDAEIERRRRLAAR